MKQILIGGAMLVAFAAIGQTSEFFEPYVATDLRLPSVPVIVNDPYFSIWSPYDKLTDGTTRHWTNDEKPILGLLRVDGETYRFMGDKQEYILSAVAPMADEERWQGRVNYVVQSDGWQSENFDDKDWAEQPAAWGSTRDQDVTTRWTEENSDIYIRRAIELSASDVEEDLYLKYSHDDVFELYVNGTKVADTGETWRNGIVLHLDGELKGLLQEGKNIIAAHCHNTTGGAYADFGLYKNIIPQTEEYLLAHQKSVDVLANNTYYTFECGPVDLSLVFTAPMIIDDYDLISTPINYVSYKVDSRDKKEHDVQIYFGASALQAVNTDKQATITEFGEADGVEYVRVGTVDQQILGKSGDHICIDWGYFYLPSINGSISAGNPIAMERCFAETGELCAVEKGEKIYSRNVTDMPVLAYVHDFGKVKSASSFMMMGYDEVYDIEYMHRRYKGYWAHGGDVTITKAFRNMADRYASIMRRARAWDKTIYDDGMASGGKEYAELLSGTYRHVMAAHKLFEDENGTLLWFSKENDSNGCVNTVDLTYPEAPLFLVYNPELQKAMMTSILDYSLSGRWTKPFAAHDLGTYPLANGQVYIGDMPLEESGNMLTLATMLCKLDGNTRYVEPYWDILSEWVDYLVEYGQDPENQLCTDDFAGHWAHNANLSLKAICGVAGYAEMAAMKGEKATAEKYMSIARRMAAKWEEMALEGDHYRLAFDRENTWSQKYNIIWDELWNLGLFSDKVMEREMAWYLKHQNKYGLPLDNRKDYTKTDWIMWIAAMSPTDEAFQAFVHPIYLYANETESRVPLSDWSDTKTGLQVGFKARSVIGGYWMKVLMDKIRGKK